MSMTLKEKVAEMQPERIGDIYWGGVHGCPANYPYLNKPELICCKSSYEDCKNYWNQPFEEQESIIKEKRHTKSITWAKLWRRIGRQPIDKIQNEEVEILIDGELRKCTLVFTDSGSNFHLEIVE